jgi:restriction system protein
LSRPSNTAVRSGSSTCANCEARWRDNKAGRGVLVTTSTFTKDAKFLSERFGGHVQLIDGAELVYMFKEVLDKDVLIGKRKPRP